MKRVLMRVEAFGCAIATVVAIARGSWVFAAILGATVVVALVWSYAADVTLGLTLLAIGNVAWAVAIAALLAAEVASGVDAWLLAATIPYTLVLAGLQWRALRRDFVASAA